MYVKKYTYYYYVKINLTQRQTHLPYILALGFEFESLCLPQLLALSSWQTRGAVNGPVTVKASVVEVEIVLLPVLSRTIGYVIDHWIMILLVYTSSLVNYLG